MINSTIRSTNKSTVVRKNEKLKEDITHILKNSGNPVSTSDLMVALNKSWHTIDRACLMLQINKKVEGFRVGKMNLWRAK